MELMIDTNVLLDIMLKRDRYTESVRFFKNNNNITII